MATKLVSVADIVSAVEAPTLKRGLQLWWRGQGQAAWQLVPQVFRYSPGRQPNYEHNALRSFQRRARTRHSTCPHENDLAAWMFLAQHYGLPTRLLDWTKAPLHALFFAVWEPALDRSDGVLWGLEPSGLNVVCAGEPGILDPTHPAAEALVRSAYSDEARVLDAALALSTAETDIRMMVQQSMFTIHASPKPLEDYKHTSLFVERILIPAKSKRHIRAQLADLGVTLSTLFPDLHHLARELRDGLWTTLPDFPKDETEAG